MAQQQPTKVMSGAVAYAGAGPVDLSSKYSLDTYLRFGLAGALCCSVTHTAVVPIDVVKTRLQVRTAFRMKKIGGGAEAGARK